jgi:hypothetical protein
MRVSRAINAKLSIHSLRGELTSAINKLRREHEFLLYFNPSLPILLVDPNSIYNMDMLLSSYAINELYGNQVKNGDKWLISI